MKIFRISTEFEFRSGLDAIRHIVRFPKSYNEFTIKRKLKKYFPKWYAKEDIGRHSVQDIMDVLQKTLAFYDLSKKQSPWTLPPSRYSPQNTMSFILEGDLDNLTKTLQRTDCAKERDKKDKHFPVLYSDYGDSQNLLKTAPPLRNWTPITSSPVCLKNGGLISLYAEQIGLLTSGLLCRRVPVKYKHSFRYQYQQIFYHL